MDIPKKKPGVGFGVMLVKDGKVLLGHRHSDAEKASSELHGEGTWTMPGGKLEFQESPEDGAVREVREEIGLTIEKRALKLVSVSNDMVHDAHFITLGFLCSEFTGEPSVMEPDEITEWRWFPLDALPSPLYFPSERVLKNYREGEIYRIT
jgi:8-oxo-dGTP diphosphatase